MNQKSPADEARLVDNSAPYLMRPSGDDPADGRNWILKAIERTGQAADAACHTWAGAFALGNDLMWRALVEFHGAAAAAEAYEAAWARIPETYRDGARKIFTFASDSAPYGLALEIETPEMVARSGLSVEELLIFWNKAFVAQDHEMWQALEHQFGAREGLIVYSRVWEGYALTFLEFIKAAIGVDKFETTEDLAKMNRAFWEAIACEVEDIETTPDKHIAVITTCPFWDNMIDMYGKDRAHRMHQKTIGATSANYYQALMKAIGLWDEFYATQDQYRCLGDGQCRMVYVRRSVMEKEGVG
ncbi:MAG: hypothetical protein QF666_13515 [Alphaproteobacteria bacterium]|nr:hypothetical protein [Alphaproteobacteria bacterium]